MLYILNICSDICQLHLNKPEGKRKKRGGKEKFNFRLCHRHFSSGSFLWLLRFRASLWRNFPQITFPFPQSSSFLPLLWEMGCERVVKSQVSGEFLEWAISEGPWLYTGRNSRVGRGGVNESLFREGNIPQAECCCLRGSPGCLAFMGWIISQLTSGKRVLFGAKGRDFQELGPCRFHVLASCGQLRNCHSSCECVLQHMLMCCLLAYANQPKVETLYTVSKKTRPGADCGSDPYSKVQT